MYNLFSFIVQLRLFLAQFVQCCTLYCTQGARPPSLRRCSCAQPGLLVLYASTRAQVHHHHADYIIAVRRAPSPRLVHLRLQACTETGVGCWDRIASLSIFALLLPIQLPRQLCQRWCRSPALEAAPASWLQHQPSRSGSSKELCPIRGGWC